MTVPEETFSGVKPVEERHRLDEVKLHAWLNANVAGYAGPLTVHQFKGGQSNPTYRLDTPGQRYVLRRKPFGKLLPSAHAVDRALDDAGRRLDPRLLRQQRPERLIHRPAHLELRAARDEIDRRAERTVRAVVGNLDREPDRDAERDAEHIQQREQPMPRDVADDVPAENARELCGHRVTAALTVWRDGVHRFDARRGVMKGGARNDGIRAVE